MKRRANSPMKILALEFSTERRSVALARSGAGGPPAVLAEAHSDSRDVGALTLVSQVLAAAKWDRTEIECLAVGVGPGSYAGIRGAIALAQGWQLARDVKLLQVSSVDALITQAQQKKLSGPINVVIDAQRNEFYLARYDIGPAGLKPIQPLRIVSLAEVQRHEAAGETMIGPEVTRWFPRGEVMFPEAAVIAELAASRTDFLAGEKMEPIYLRETNFIKAPPLRVIPGV